MTADEKAKLKQATLQLIARVNEIHRAGGGALPLNEIVELSGAQAPVDLTKREPVQFQSRNERGGVFSNRGSKLGFNTSGIAVEVPEKIEGEYEVGPDRLVLQFVPDATITGKKLFVKATLRGVTADERGVEVDVKSPVPLPVTKIAFD
jgi:hypothetical protein